MFASIAAFADTTVPTNIQQLIDAKDWNALSTNAFDSAIVKTWQTADADALVDAAIQNKFYLTAYAVALTRASKLKMVEACEALANNNFVTKANGTRISIHWSDRLACDECRDVVSAAVEKLRILLAANLPANIENVNLPTICNFIVLAETRLNIGEQPIQISDSIIQQAARNYRVQTAFTLKNASYTEQYAQIYAKYFAALPENSDLATRQNVTWEKLSYVKWINKYYGTQFNDILYAKSNINGKVCVAIEANDADKILDVLEYINQVELKPESIQKIIIVLNAQKADWRQADVLKALKNINSMYTIKLYDDRDTWEPIISKVRAMIEVRQ